MKICVNKEAVFEYVKPAPLNHKLLLLTHGGVCVVGVWRGEQVGSNGTYRGWAGLPGRDKELEEKMGYR